MVRTKLTVSRWPRTSRVPPWLMKRHQQRKKDKRPFKIKLALLEQLTENIKKNGNVIKTIAVRRKSRHFTDRNAKTFLSLIIVLNFLIIVIIFSFKNEIYFLLP